MGFFQEFKDFAMRGNVVDLAVGLVIGAEFGKIVNSAVNDLIMPPIGKVLGGDEFTALAYPLGQNKAGEDISIKYGSFIQNVFNFIVIAFAVFMVVKIMNSLQKKEEEAPAAPPKNEVLLEEIRDLLAKQK